MKTIKDIAFQLMIGLGILFISMIFDHIIGIEQMNVLTLVIGFVLFLLLLFKMRGIIKSLGFTPITSDNYSIEDIDISIIFATSGLILLVMTVLQ